MKNATTTKPKKQGWKRLPTGPNGGVQLLLIQSVENLGDQGDVVEVKHGYALNYLIPQGLATMASDHHQRMVVKHREKLLQLEDTRLKSLKDLADVISRQSVTIESTANDEGHLYGSVGEAEVIAALKQAEIAISIDQVKLDGPMKELGLFTVRIRLQKDIEADLKVWVVPESEE